MNSSRPEKRPLISIGLCRGLLTNEMPFQVSIAVATMPPPAGRCPRIAFGQSIILTGAQCDEIVPQRLVRHRGYRWSVLPDVRAHHLIVHLVLQQCRLWRALEDVVEPLVSKLAEVSQRHRIDFVSAQYVRGVTESGDQSTLSEHVIVGTDDQIIFRIQVSKTGLAVPSILSSSRYARPLTYQS